LIPPPLREWANLETQVIVVGAGEGIEIWNADDFETALGAEAESFLQSMESE
jgi:DNA-binding transcriptional regulator/RsmH inhibitor MraZ